MAEIRSDAQNHPMMSRGIRIRLLILLAVSVALFIAGILSPMITLTQFMLINSTFSVLSGVWELLSNGQILLFLVVAGFSILLPLLKMHILFRLLSDSRAQSLRTRRYLHLMHQYGRWSMLDVMVVAVMIVTVKLGAIASIQVHYGLYLFGGSVLLIMWITNRVVRMTEDDQPLSSN